MDAPGAPRLLVLLAAGHARPGTSALLDRVLARARAGAAVHVLLTEEGLALLATDWPARLAAAGVATSLCARSARARRIEPASAPATVAWSSLTAFLRDAPEGFRLWSAFP